MAKILFQGDSITDAGRADQNDPLAIGSGYVRLIHDMLALDEPENTVYNCGISGDRVVNLLARWKKDCINIAPDILTIMIGVNDIWHDFHPDTRNNGVDIVKYEKVYRMILEEALEKLPNIKIILMGSYLLHGTATDEVFDMFYKGVEERRNVTKKLAEEYNLEYIDLQKAFDDVYDKFPAGYLSGDGVHPTGAGHELIKRTWLEKYYSIK